MSNSADEYNNRLKAIQVTALYQWETVEDARRCIANIRLTQQELRLLKSDVLDTMYLMRGNFTTKRKKILPNSIAIAIHSLNMSRSAQRLDLNKKELRELGPYQRVMDEIDQLVNQLSHAKLEIDRWIVANKAQRSSATQNETPYAHRASRAFDVSGQATQQSRYGTLWERLHKLLNHR